MSARIIPDLWPDDISPDSTSPVAILRRQAGQLAARTSGLVEAEVKTRREEKEHRVVHEFRVVARPLDYTTVLFVAWHSVELLYPVLVKFKPWDDEARREWEKTLPHLTTGDGSIVRMTGGEFVRREPPEGDRQASSQQELIELLRDVLTSSYCRSIITSLVARINDEGAQPEPPPSEASAGTASPKT